MQTTRRHTALVLFLNEAADLRRKDFGMRGGNRHVVRALNRRTQKLAAQTGLPVLQLPQRGHCFGERLINALSDAFAAGYDRLIAIGNDCPTLSVKRLLEAERALDRHRVVLGPDARGGVYLIGVHRSTFCPEKLAGCDWQTSQLLQQLASCAEPHSLLYLPVALDLNSGTDLLNFTVSRPQSRLARLVRGALVAAVNYRAAARPTTGAVLLTSPNRGPPRRVA